MTRGRRLAVIANGGGQEVILQVGIFDAGAGADEAAAFEMIGGAESGLEQQPFKPDHALGDQIHLAVERDRLRAGHLKKYFQMVMEILPDARQIMDGR